MPDRAEDIYDLNVFDRQSASFMESSNNIIHPTRLKVLACGSSCFERVMMSVRKHEGSQFALFDRVVLQQGLLRLSNLADKKPLPQI